MTEPRLIKKYPNRRLYDTAESRYITVDDVRRLVLERVDFRILDAKTDEDLTRSTLLQIITEQEENGKPIFSADVLQQVIRFYGDTVQSLASDFLERSLAVFAEQQERYEQQLRGAASANPFTIWTDLSQQNLELWSRMQRGFFDALAAQRARGKAARGPDANGAPG
ncbi:MAG TPA: polyhydroxyalkanoate synthesis repressor PhaR [Gemmatimonadales bacterium]|nr:polyhydroxyalkanoate synthesis repressor PhaR [Gemmatimonadales bacterium]